VTVTEENQTESVMDPSPAATATPPATAAKSEPLLVGLWDDVEGFVCVVQVAGQGVQFVLAESLPVAIDIAALAFPGSDIEASGYSKIYPPSGEQVLTQVAMVDVDPKLNATKDIEEAKRRTVNYERRTY
jgi:hypothetical protein